MLTLYQLDTCFITAILDWTVFGLNFGYNCDFIFIWRLFDWFAMQIDWLVSAWFRCFHQNVPYICSIYSTYLFIFYGIFASIYWYYYFIIYCCYCCLLIFLIYLVEVVLVLLLIWFYCQLSLLRCLCCHCLLGPYYSFAVITLGFMVISAFIEFV